MAAIAVRCPCGAARITGAPWRGDVLTKSGFVKWTGFSSYQDATLEVVVVVTVQVVLVVTSVNGLRWLV